MNFWLFNNKYWSWRGSCLWLCLFCISVFLCVFLYIYLHSGMFYWTHQRFVHIFLCLPKDVCCCNDSKLNFNLPSIFMMPHAADETPIVDSPKEVEHRWMQDDRWSSACLLFLIIEAGSSFLLRVWYSAGSSTVSPEDTYQ